MLRSLIISLSNNYYLTNLSMDEMLWLSNKELQVTSVPSPSVTVISIDDLYNNHTVLGNIISDIEADLLVKKAAYAKQAEEIAAYEALPGRPE